MLTLETPGLWQARRCRGSLERFVDRAQDLVRFRWFSEDVLNAARTRQPMDLRYVVVICMEDDGDRHQKGLRSNSTDEGKPVHVRHHDVGNNEIGELSASYFQTLEGVTGLQQAMTEIAQQGDVQPAVRGVGIHNQN